MQPKRMFIFVSLMIATTFLAAFRMIDAKTVSQVENASMRTPLPVPPFRIRILPNR
jgi:hypothetical protein